jgi:hypothetical protein
MVTNSESVILGANQPIFEVNADEGHCAPIRMPIPKPLQAAVPVGTERIQVLAQAQLHRFEFRRPEKLPRIRFRENDSAIFLVHAAECYSLAMSAFGPRIRGWVSLRVVQ